MPFTLPERDREMEHPYTPPRTKEWDVTASSLLKADFLFYKKSLHEIQGHVSQVIKTTLATALFSNTSFGKFKPVVTEIRHIRNCKYKFCLEINMVWTHDKKN